MIGEVLVVACDHVHRNATGGLRLNCTESVLVPYTLNEDELVNFLEEKGWCVDGKMHFCCVDHRAGLD